MAEVYLYRILKFMDQRKSKPDKNGFRIFSLFHRWMVCYNNKLTLGLG